MKWLKSLPLLRLIIPFGLGIIWAFFHPSPVNETLILAVSILTLINLILYRFKIFHSNYHNRWVFGIFTFALLFVLGLTYTNFKVERYNPIHFSHFLSSTNHSTSFIAVVNSEPEEKANSVKAVIEIQQISEKDNLIQTLGNCLVYFKKNDSLQIKYGDQIIFRKQPEDINPPANFDEFDYKRYLAHHYIYQRLYLSNHDFQIIGNHPPSWLKGKAIQWRMYLLNRYRKFGINGEELAILSALTLGQKESLTTELKSAYSSAGAMHVLAVSGLHVGIIFLVLNYVLGWMDTHKTGKIVKAILLIILVWLYAVITGLSPSVIRAATMFSLVIFAKSFSQSSNIYNTLSLSAFIILIYKPFMILEVGFQLSYLAVLGIIYLHPYLYNLFKFKIWILDQAWNITCVSVAAQLATAPLGILYFHQFPTYFLFSNLIVIPAAFIIMGVSIGFQILSFIPFIGNGIAYLLKGIVWILNTSVLHLEQLPKSLLGGLDISVFETWLFYLIIMGTTIWLTQSKRKFALYSLLLTVIFASTQTFEKWNQLHQKEITFYQSNKDVSIEFINGYSANFVGDSTLINNSSKMQFYVYHHWWNRGISINNPTKAISISKVTQFENTKILRVENDVIFSPNQINILRPEIIYFNTYKFMLLDSITNNEYHPIVVIGSKSSKKMNKKIRQFCNSRNWNFYDLKETGALKIRLKDDFSIKELLTAIPIETNESKLNYSPNTSLNE